MDESGAAKIEDVYYVTGIAKDTSRYTDFYAQAVSLYDGTITEFKLNDSTENETAFNDSSWTTDSGYVSGRATLC